MTTLRSLLTPDKPDVPQPHLDRVSPPAALPGGEIDVHGSNLAPQNAQIPHATIGDISAPVLLSRPTRATIQIPEGTISGDLIVHRSGQASNPLNLRVAVPMAENLHPVARELEKALGEAEGVKLAWRPQLKAIVDADTAATLLKLIDTLDDDDDVQTVWGNYEIPDDVMEKLG